MSTRRIARPQKALFPRLREIREEELGWELVEVVSRLPGHKPSASSIYRLEQGVAMRASNVAHLRCDQRRAEQHARCEQGVEGEVTARDTGECAQRLVTHNVQRYTRP